MPSWQPNWIDVAFDYIGAAVAIDTLTGVSRQLKHQLDIRGSLMSQALEQWSGPGHDRWVEVQQQLVAEHLELASMLRDDARGIEVAARAARREQTNREAEREVWWRESAAEAALAAAAPILGTQAPIAW